MKNPLHSKSGHMQCSCYPMQVHRTCEAMNVFFRIGWSLRIPSDYPLGYLYPPDFLARNLFGSFKPTCIFFVIFSYRQKIFFVMQKHISFVSLIPSYSLARRDSRLGSHSF